MTHSATQARQASPALALSISPSIPRGVAVSLQLKPHSAAATTNYKKATAVYAGHKRQ